MINSTTSNTSFLTTWNTSEYQDGNYLIRLLVFNSAGKNATAMVYDLQVDNTGPGASSPSVTPSAGGISQTYSFTVNLTDAGSTAISSGSALFYNDSSTSSCTLTQVTGATYACNVSLITAGQYYLVNVTARDSLWNNYSTNFTLEQFNVSVNNYTYNISSYSVAPRSFTSAGTTWISGYVYYAYANGSSNGTGVNNASLTLSGCASGTIYANSTGFFNTSFAVSSGCTHTITVTGTAVYASSSISVGPSGGSSSSSTGTNALPTTTQATESVETEAVVVEPVVAERQEQSLDENSRVQGTFTPTSSSFTVSYQASANGFQGRLTFRMPFDYADYQNGLISLSPVPSRVLPGSVIAEYDEVNLAPRQEFNVRAIVMKPMDKSVIQQFAAPVAVPAAPTPEPTPYSAVKPASKGSAGDYLARGSSGQVAQAGSDYLLPIIVVIVLIAAGVAYWMYSHNKKR
ncbi:hypothetical protein AUJ65_04780 [Candidatus Micrarchaeota archaeon CG1_02_51_15]|nr:MAG: hypothetical protein AUJ65_04780 [Candidatus Micrarchaeota archaeon CG1_02_51_15]